MENKNRRRCSKEIEKIKSCGEANCKYYIPGGNFGGMIKRDLKIDLELKYFVDNLCNKCSDKFEDTLTAFYNYWTNGRRQEEFGNKNIEVDVEGGHGGKYFISTKDRIMKIWEGNKVWEFNPKEKSLDNILKQMNY